MIIDSIRTNGAIFPELVGCPLEDINKMAISCIKYNFKLSRKESELKHCLVVIKYTNYQQADSIFNLIRGISLEKSGFPGLTYSNDFIIKDNNVVFWLNSSCGYSYNNHIKFASSLEKMMKTKPVISIRCKCGEVQCQ